jgi:hypothetical protein
MEVAALITWVATAAGGFVMLGVWIANGGLRSDTGGSRFPPVVILGHFLLAAIGLVVWIAFVISDDAAGLAWAGFVILLPVALLGFVMLARWLAGRRAAATATAVGPEAEQRFPVPVVVVHGLLAVTTLVLVLIAAIDVG